MAKSKKNEPIEVLGKILKVVRDTKDMAQVTFIVPQSAGGIIPIGDAKIIIESVQKEIVFGNSEDEE